MRGEKQLGDNYKIVRNGPTFGVASFDLPNVVILVHETTALQHANFLTLGEYWTSRTVTYRDLLFLYN